MKNLLFLLLTLIVIGFTSCEENGNGDGSNENDTLLISMGSGYLNNIFYNLSTGDSEAVVSNNWDIAFFTDIMSSTIVTNDGSGVKLYTWPNGDINAWDQTLSIDNLNLDDYLYNSDTTWELGAFEKNALGHPDYGWGTYSMNTHNLTGDSIYIIQLVDDSYKKLIIEQKASSDNAYYFKYADLDGGNEQEVVIDLNEYANKNFGYYSLVNGTEVDREPATSSWDLLFTTYVAEIPSGGGNFTPYIVSGVLSNTGVSVEEIAGNPQNVSLADTTGFSETISIIGSDWKDFNMSTFQYELAPDVSYFVKAKTGGIYHIQFTDFEGSATGNIRMLIEKVQ